MPQYVFIYYITFFIASIAYCYFISKLFNRALTAAIVGCIVFFMGFFIYIGLNNSIGNYACNIYYIIITFVIHILILLLYTYSYYYYYNILLLHIYGYCMYLIITLLTIIIIIIIIINIIYYRHNKFVP